MARGELRHLMWASPPTARELEVLALVASGKSTKEVASLLRVSRKTAATHRLNVMAKLQVYNASDLTRAVIRMKLIES